MGHVAAAPTPATRPSLTRALPVGGARFDWALTVLSSWIVAGLYIDGWAHTHGRVDTSFFTPYHALLYAGLAAVLLLGAATISFNHARGYAWRRALPAGYGLAFAGALVFAAGGVADLIWHTLFGIEVHVEALVSPTHLLLAVGGWLVVSGPLRAAWGRPATSSGWAEHLPVVLSLTFMLSLLTFFTQIAHPVPNPEFWGGAAPVGQATTSMTQAMGIVSLLLDAAILMGIILLALRRWALRPGALTLLLALNSLGMALLYHGDASLALVVPVAVVTAAAAGLVADGLLAWLRPSAERPGALRLFAFAVPVAVYGANFAAVALLAGLWWSVHLWAGALALTGTVGLLLSYLLAPPAIPSRPAP